MIEKEARAKKEQLIKEIKQLGSLLVAFSGGVDSTFLLAVAHEALGKNVVAATATSPTYPSAEREAAAKFTKQRGIQHIVFPSEETNLPAFLSNPPDRCYHCKKHLSRELLNIAREKGISHVAHAANADDLRDYRPGLKAAEETGIIAPLLDVGLSKHEIRFLSRRMGLSTWDKPAMACLASRIPYGESITKKKLSMIEQAEAFLRQHGLNQVRVRHHGSIARIEVGEGEIEKISKSSLRAQIVSKFKELGFLHIALDLEGYVSGSLNRELGEPVKKG
ncbi:MAG: ATP-dependent sacrificial sulfur transferase LarE [Deltaproteobacteria bacterium]|nr:MAG: ATP-dependent sacrificial sulfur transferase LarE [Deltaproteobacteria bacterium]